MAAEASDHAEATLAATDEHVNRSSKHRHKRSSEPIGECFAQLANRSSEQHAPQLMTAACVYAALSASGAVYTCSCAQLTWCELATALTSGFSHAAHQLAVGESSRPEQEVTAVLALDVQAFSRLLSKLSELMASKHRDASADYKRLVQQAAAKKFTTQVSASYLGQ